MRINVCVVVLLLGLQGCVVEQSEFDARGSTPFANPSAHDHYGDFNWQLEIEGVTQGAFVEVGGLGSKTEIVFRGGQHLRPSFRKWAKDSQTGKAGARDLVLVAIDGDGRRETYRLVGAQVLSVTPASGNKAMQEEIEMVIERLERG